MLRPRTVACYTMTTMTDRLEYRLVGPAKRQRGGSIEIAAPKALVDGATAMRGPLLDHVRAPRTHKVMSTTYDGQGGALISFDLNNLAQSYYSGSSAERSLKTLDIITHLDGYAHRQGIPDPRLTIGTSHIGADPDASFYSRELDDFRISFEHPAVDDATLAENIRVGMVWAAGNLYLHSSERESEEQVSVHYTDHSGLVMRARGVQQFPVFASDRRATPPEGRIEVAGAPTQPGNAKEAHARLVGLIGIVRALDPLPPQLATVTDLAKRTNLR